ncbi:MAG: acyltransferase family protein [Clostridiales Family XIII bacterium]|jgi:fucose 4-O-acetylase-like acetyltransferase|nr:acyltransferase family protein [Clostridiales Family XIII bacterium]
MGFLKRLYYPEPNLYSDEKGRVYFYDNLRFILIVLVVLSHFIMRVEGLRGKIGGGDDFDELSAFYEVFSWFMMPLFIFITGFFSKSLYSKEGNFRRSRIVTFFALFIVMDTLVYFSNCLGAGKFVAYQPYIMYKSQWFLFSCGIWFLLIPLMRKVSAAVMIPVSIFVGVLGGFILGGVILSVSKIFAFFPFFVIGYYMTRAHIERFLQVKARCRILALAFFVALFAVTLVFLQESLLYARPVEEAARSYWTMFYNVRPSHLFVPSVELQCLIRVGWYLAAFGTSALFMLIVPMKKTIWTKFGSRTLQIYIWHSVVVRLIRLTPFYGWVSGPSRGLSELIVLVAVIAVSFLLAFKPLGAPFAWVTKLVAKIPDKKPKTAALGA